VLLSIVANAEINLQLVVGLKQEARRFAVFFYPRAQVNNVERRSPLIVLDVEIDPGAELGMIRADQTFHEFQVAALECMMERGHSFTILRICINVGLT